MMVNWSKNISWNKCVSLFLLVMASVGCSITSPSEETRFYFLSAPEIPAQSFDSKDWDKQMVAVGPIHFSDYLKRSALVKRVGNNEMSVAKLDKWGGSLENEFETALLKNLIKINPGTPVVLKSGMLSQRSTRQLKIDVYRFGANEKGMTVLEATWQWTEIESGKNILGNFSESIAAEASFQGQVAAMSELVKRFSQKITASFNND